MLDRFPEIGRVVPEFEHAPFRELIFQNYRIVYEVIDGRPWILLVAHGAVDLRSEFKRRGIEHE